MSSILTGNPSQRSLDFRGTERELVHLAGDPDTGLASTVRVDKAKFETKVSYTHGPKDFVLTVDVYLVPGAPPEVHLICPKCQHQLRVPGDKKAIDFDIATGKLSIEKFQCTWEMPDAGEHVPGLISGGMSLCKWTAAIDGNVAKDA